MPAGDLQPDEIRLGRPEPAQTDDGSEFVNLVLAAIHPTVAALREQAFKEERMVARAEFEEAVKADLAYALPGSVLGFDRSPEE